MLEVLGIGNKVDIRSLIKDDDERRKMYYSQIVDIENSTQIKITMPTHGTKIVPLPTGVRFECTFYTSKGLFQGIFEVGQRRKEGNLPVLILEIKRPLKKVQRREYYRFECTLPMKYRIADRAEKIAKEDLNNMNWKDGIVLDLSGGGMRFVLPENIPVDTYLQYKLVLEVRGEYQEFFLYGDVISCKNKENNIRLHECRTQFVKMSEAERDMIIAYIFTEERKKRNVNG